MGGDIGKLFELGVGTSQVIGGFLQFFLGPFALRHVARHFTKPAQLSFFITQSGDDDIGPEAGAILAHAPTFIYHPSLLDSSLEFTGGQVRGFRWIKNRKVLADYFL